MAYVLIVGAKSDIARAVAVEYAARGYDLYLCGRNIRSLEAFARDLNIRYQCKAVLLELDILDYASHAVFYYELPEQPQGVFFAVGLLPNQLQAQSDFAQVQEIYATNLLGLVSLADIIANDFAARKSGFIIVLSSVAGDRGRQSNYYYGSAKAALSAYLSGLRNRLHNDAVRVMTVKPGFVNTRMTRDMPLPPLLTASPEQVARDIMSAQAKGRDVVYSRWFWRFIMMVIRAIPESLFKKMNL